jgi:2,5-dihydroxypyridine 5,6-dioxygenase
MKKIEMIKGAQKMVDECAKVTAGENVLILTDTLMPLSMAEVLAIACKERGAETMIMIMSPLQVVGSEPPSPVGEAMQKAQVVFVACSRGILHSASRKRASQAGARFFNFSESSEEDMMRGAIEANFLETRGLIEKVANVLRTVKEAHITTPGGTDIYFDFRGRPEKMLILNGLCHHPGDAVSLNLEVALSPKVGSAQGVLVCDASITLFKPGLIEEPIRAKVENGMVTELSGGSQARKLRDLLASMGDPMVYNVSELGIGLNPKAKVIGVPPQDRGVYGTCHVGFGPNTGWGGNIKAATHFDFVMYAPRIEVDGTTLLENYRFNL